MKIVIQRVTQAEVKVEGKVVGAINKGLFVLVGVKKGDKKESAQALAEKLLKLRIMADENGKMNKSVIDDKAEVLVVSQFTLISNTSDGNRPSFIDAQEPLRAKEIYEYFIKLLKDSGLNIQTGSFGQYMKIKLELDGPVTIVIES